MQANYFVCCRKTLCNGLIANNYNRKRAKKKFWYLLAEDRNQIAALKYRKRLAKKLLLE